VFAECLAVKLACGDQRRLTGSGSALEAFREDALHKSTYFTFVSLTYTALLYKAKIAADFVGCLIFLVSFRNRLIFKKKCVKHNSGETVARQLVQRLLAIVQRVGVINKMP